MTMANLKQLVLLLAIVAVAQHRQVVSSGTIEGCLRDVSNRIDDLEESFDDSIQRIFYDRQPLARSTNNLALMALSGKMAESIALMHAEQRKMMLIVYDIIKERFIDRQKPLDEVLMDNRNLIELVVQRSVKYSTRLGIAMIDDRLREIYLILLQSDGDPQVKQLARDFFQVLRDKDDMIQQSSDIIDQSWDRYIEENEHRLSEQQIADTFKAIDKLIDESIEAADRSLLPDSEDPLEDLDEEVMLEHYISPKLVTDVRMAIYSTVGKVYDPDEDAIDEVDMKAIEEYKRSVLA